MVLVVLMASRVLAWGPEGHKAIARVAMVELEKTNPAAAAMVREILDGESVEEASLWPDEVRASRAHSGRLAKTQEGKDFNATHPDNAMWHFVDLPLGVTSYAQDERFTEKHDVVQMVTICAQVLEGKSEFLTKKQALRCLIHFVGDLHQPLHVGSGYFKFGEDGRAELVTDPEEALQRGVSKDNGANKLMLDSELGLDKKLNFHRYVDENLVERLAPDVDSLAEVLRKDVAGVSASKGAWKDWPAQWAQESVEASRVFYDGMTFSKRYPKTWSFWMMYVKFKPGAAEKFSGVVEDRLVRAARHLADVLGALRWAK
jgi:hypothetical protein